MHPSSPEGCRARSRVAPPPLTISDAGTRHSCGTSRERRPSHSRALAGCRLSSRLLDVAGSGFFPFAALPTERSIRNPHGSRGSPGRAEDSSHRQLDCVMKEHRGGDAHGSLTAAGTNPPMRLKVPTCDRDFPCSRLCQLRGVAIPTVVGLASLPLCQGQGRPGSVDAARSETWAFALHIRPGAPPPLDRWHSRAADQTSVFPYGQDVRDVGFSALAGLLSILALRRRALAEEDKVAGHPVADPAHLRGEGSRASRSCRAPRRAHRFGPTPRAPEFFSAGADPIRHPTPAANNS